MSGRLSVIVPPAASQRLLLTQVTWKEYSRLLRVLGRHPLRFTYDRGVLEIMTLSHEHESYCYLLSRLVDALTEELNLPVKGGGSTTFRKRLRKRGLEPDSCWWIANEPRVRGKIEIDLKVDPPPDLVLEVDITHSSLDRMSIYATLGVPEVWRYDGTTLKFHLLQKDKKGYAEAANSLSFLPLKDTDLPPFLNLRGQMDENAILRQFRQWARQVLLSGGPVATP